jgi:hypothetical protein
MTAPASVLTPDEVAKICDLAGKSAIAKFNWLGRGPAPLGYTKGVAVSFGCALRKHAAGSAVFAAVALANTGKDATDALSWYASKFKAVGMSNALSGRDTLRHVYVLLMGLGMRESSGKHCEGRDTSAGNTGSLTAEAGAWQTSWNIKSSAPTLFQGLFDQYAAGAEGYLSVFAEGVHCSVASWKNWGRGAGTEFQHMEKAQPMFAADVCALGLRVLRKHWGPINRRQAQVRSQADDMLKQVQTLLGM